MKAKIPRVCRQLVRNRCLVPFTVSTACLISAVTLFQALAEPTPPKVRPSGGIWEADRKFEFEDEQKKTRRSISGISCPQQDGRRGTCLVVFDEGTMAHYIN